LKHQSIVPVYEEIRRFTDVLQILHITLKCKTKMQNLVQFQESCYGLNIGQVSRGLNPR